LEAIWQARNTKGPLLNHHCTSTVHRQGLQRWAGDSSKEDKTNGLPKETNHRLALIGTPIHSLSLPAKFITGERPYY